MKYQKSSSYKIHHNMSNSSNSKQYFATPLHFPSIFKLYFEPLVYFLILT